MLKNYLKTAWRNLIKHKLYSSIGILGLGIGMACCILLMAFIRFEWSHDRFHEQSDRIYRIVAQHQQLIDGPGTTSATPPILAPELAKRFPDIEKTVRLSKKQLEIEAEGNLLGESVHFADSGFFDLFSFSFKNGNPGTALDEPGDIVLTSTTSQKLFGTDKSIGKTVTVYFDEEQHIHTVSAIVEDPPAASSLQFGYVIPHSNLKYTLSEHFRTIAFSRWDFSVVDTYLLLNSETSKSGVERKLPSFVDTHYGDRADKVDLNLQSLTDIYLQPRVRSDLTKTSNPLYSWMLSGIALILLLVACINYISLALGRMAGRAKEISIRQATGAGRTQLFRQFLVESYLLCGIALLIAVLGTEWALPYFRQLSNRYVELSLFSSPFVWINSMFLLAVVGFITGGYPAYKYSNAGSGRQFDSAAVISGNYRFIRGLIITQFAICVSLGIGSIVISQQMRYVSNKDLGFNPENVVLIDPSSSTDVTGKYASRFKEKVSGYPEISAVSASYETYGSGIFKGTIKNRGTNEIPVQVNAVDPGYLETMKIELKTGRNFSESRISDLQEGALVNQAFVEVMGWDNPIGKSIPEAKGKELNEVLNNKKIIGVVENYYYESLHKKLMPLVLLSRKSIGGGADEIAVRVRGSSLSGAIDKLKKSWFAIAPGQAAQFTFLDEIVQNQYREDQKWQNTIFMSMLIVVFIACFGLFGLALMSTRRRAKEIGIRKVLGATITQIIGKLSKDFLKLVLIGYVIAIPIAWLVMNRWLAEFAYRIEIGPGIFALAGGAAVLITLLTVSWQTIRAATANPADNLRSE